MFSGDRISESESGDKVHHELNDFDRQNAQHQQKNYQQHNGDPTIYALLDERPQIYTKAIDNNSLVATKTTVTPIMHFNPCNYRYQNNCVQQWCSFLWLPTHLSFKIEVKYEAIFSTKLAAVHSSVQKSFCWEHLPNALLGVFFPRVNDVNDFKKKLLDLNRFGEGSGLD